MEWRRGNGEYEFAKYFQTTSNRKFQTDKHLRQCCDAAIDALKGQKLTLRALCKQLNIAYATWSYYRSSDKFRAVALEVEDLIKQRNGSIKSVKEVKQQLKPKNLTIINNPQADSKDYKEEIVNRSFSLIAEKLRRGEYDDRQLIEIFKEAVKMSGFLKPEIAINNCLASQKVFVTKEDVDRTNQIIEDVLNEQ